MSTDITSTAPVYADTGEPFMPGVHTAWAAYRSVKGAIVIVPVAPEFSDHGAEGQPPTWGTSVNHAALRLSIMDRETPGYHMRNSPGNIYGYHTTAFYSTPEAAAANPVELPTPEEKLATAMANAADAKAETQRGQN